MTTSDIEKAVRHWRVWPWRKPAFSEAALPALAEYQSLKPHLVRRFFGFIALMFFCFIYGFFFSVLAPNYFAFLVLPVVFVAFLTIWALPNVNWAPTRQLICFFYAFFIVLIIWPNYLAIALPGLPWITLIRMTSFPMTILLLSCYSMSPQFRADLVRSLRTVSAIPILLGIFIVIQLLSIGLSKNISASIQKFIVAQTSWTAAFFVGAYLFSRPGQIKRWALILWAMAIFVSIIAIWEYRLGRLPWAGHIPSFLKIDDAAVQDILAVHMRAYTNRYRAEATFSTPLGLAEYLALTLPFVWHFCTPRWPRRVRLLACISVPLIVYADFLTNSKLGMVGALGASSVYFLMFTFKYWRRNKSSLIAASAFFFYPAAIGLIGVLMAASHRFYIMIFGDASHTASTQTRIEQMHVGLAKFFQWPFGYGIGQAAATIHEGSGDYVTIDSYFLSVLIEYGLIGFITYYGIFSIAIYEGSRRYLTDSTNSEDQSFLLPIVASFIAFIIAKSVFSQQDNHPVVFMMLGALLGLIASRRNFGKSSKARGNEPALPSGGRPRR
jgi:hypothetical protein